MEIIFVLLGLAVLVSCVMTAYSIGKSHGFEIALDIVEDEKRHAESFNID